MAQRGRPGRLIVVMTRRSSTEITEPCSCARRLAKVEAEESPEPSVIRERVRPRTDRDTTEERLVRTAEEAHPSGCAIGREEQVLLAIDEDTRDARQIGMASRYLPVRQSSTSTRSAPVCGDVDSTAARVKVRVGVNRKPGLAPGGTGVKPTCRRVTGLGLHLLLQKA